MALYLGSQEIRQVVLDVDGTITDLSFSLEQRLCSAAQDCGLEVAAVQRDFERLRAGKVGDAGNAHAGMRRIYPNIGDMAVEEAVARFHHHERTNPYPEVLGSIETIQWLVSHNISIALCTAANLETLAVRLPAIGISLSWFAEMSTWDYEPRKPDPRTLDRIFQKTGIPQQKTLFIGDSPTDQKTAAEVNFVAVYMHGLTPRSHFEQTGMPHHQILERLADVPSILRIG